MFDQETARKRVEARLLIAGLVLVPTFQLWQFYIGAVRRIAEVAHMQIAQEKVGPGSLPMVVGSLSLEDYFSPYGVKVLMPHDLILVAYSVAVVLSVTTIVVLAQALLAVEDKAQDRVEQLTARGMRYFGRVLTFLVFFVVVHLIEESLFPFDAIFQGNMWVIIGLALLVALAIRAAVGRAMGRVGVK